MKRILIFGGSGFLGRALYRELHPYFDVYATYCSQEQYATNKRYFSYNFHKDSPTAILRTVMPDVIISALRGNAQEQYVAHDILIDFAHLHESKLLFLSSANVFDGFWHYPSYEHDKTFSESVYGLLKIQIENKIIRMPPFSWAIVRLPMVFGANSPRLFELKNAIEKKKPYEIFPNTVINLTTDYFVTQQLHYIINRNLWGIFHLGSTDLTHHDEFIFQLVDGLHVKEKPIYKHVYASNHDRYIVALTKDNTLPKHLSYRCEEVLAETLRKMPKNK
jgi:dTDP-4-dehydrorhamnose reductase